MPYPSLVVPMKTVPNQNENVDPTNVDPGDKSQEPVEKPGENKYKEDMFRFKREAREAQQREAELADRIKQLEEDKLKTASNYKELYEKKNEEVETLRKEKDNDRNVFFNFQKVQAVERAALEQGIRKEALEDLKLMDTEMVEIETTDRGSVNIHGASEFVEKLKASRPYWFKEQGPPNVNTGNPNFNQGKALSYSDILKLQKTDPAKYAAEMKKLIEKRNAK